ncbi:MAG: SMODS domain-containing nucleotidyltransferase [Faecalibacterium sp.]
MALATKVGGFDVLCSNIELDNFDEMEKSSKSIAKKLNSVYYDLDNDDTSHLYIVGSVGRKTAIKGSSDLDILFDLPSDTYKKFDAYESNGQSALLQEVKKFLQERYPKTDISGDGQVVVIEFSRYTVELVPGSNRLTVVSNTRIQTMVEVGNILTLFQNKTHAKRATITLTAYTLIFAISFASGKMSRGLNLVDC